MKWTLPGAGIALLVLVAASADADPRFEPPTETPRYIAFISDLHMSLGQDSSGWHPYEDFRWPNALRGFLAEVSRRGEDRVDLVIVGDFLELWQPPQDITCKGRSAGAGCTVEEMVEITRRVLLGHSQTISDLGAFSQLGDNRIYLIPGNHDAALLLPEVWDELAGAVGAGSGRVALIETGIWTSPDGRLVVEHGHQIGADANRYKTWPSIRDPATGLVVRPWGERFVQKLFNETEREYPMIDNLSPETAGARYRMADRGLWRSIGDIARFLAFNLFETSLSQKAQFLGPEQTADEPVKWDLPYARDELGWRLMALALPPEDPLREQLLAEPAPQEIVQLRGELARFAASELSDEEIQQLCDQIAIRGGPQTCVRPTLGYLVQHQLVPRARVMRAHLSERAEGFGRMNTFIYGNTHQLEEGHPVRVNAETIVEVFNTGAFQRVMEERDYLERLAQRFPGATPAAGLRLLTLQEDFRPCYTVILAPFQEDRYRAKTWRWLMPEDGPGELVEVGDPRCAW
jgi:UDP-2,3-diacylglucosamine pyrophosphatase LpxH